MADILVLAGGAIAPLVPFRRRCHFILGSREYETCQLGTPFTRGDGCFLTTRPDLIAARSLLCPTSCFPVRGVNFIVMIHAIIEQKAQGTECFTGYRMAPSNTKPQNTSTRVSVWARPPDPRGCVHLKTPVIFRQVAKFAFSVFFHYKHNDPTCRSDVDLHGKADMEPIRMFGYEWWVKAPRRLRLYLPWKTRIEIVVGRISAAVAMAIAALLTDLID